MDRDVAVRTPESIAFRYDLAGLGSRALAVAVDMVVQIVVLLLIVWGLVALAGTAAGRASARGPEDSLTNSLAIAFVVFIIFAIFYGYFIVFEAFWNGQTPGKKLLGIRVVRDGGYPLDFGGAFLRNLVRIAEQILGFYAISALSSLVSPENKRLGDYAAGTIVVRESRMAKPLTLAQALAPEERRPAGAYLDAGERRIVDGFLERRARLDALSRRRIASTLAERFRARAPDLAQGLSDEEFLECL